MKPLDKDLARLTRFAASLGLPLGAFAAIATGGTAQADSGGAAGGTGSTSGITYFPAGIQFASSQTVTKVGKRSTTGGCEFSGSGSGTAESATNVEVETSVDPSTCTATFEEGTPVAGATLGSGNQNSSSTSTSSASTAAANVTAAAKTDPTAYQDNQWLDPLGIQLNAQEQFFNWNTNGSCVTSWSETTKWSWYFDGWSPRWRNDNSGGVGCNEDWSYSNSAFQNGIFCAFVTTYTYFGYDSTKNQLTGDKLAGFPDGHYSWSYQDFVNGGCSSLIHHGHIDHH
jgi:hypothetical protein